SYTIKMSSLNKNSATKIIKYLSSEANAICFLCQRETSSCYRNRLIKDGVVTTYGKTVEKIFTIRIDRLDFPIMCKNCKRRVTCYAEKQKKLTTAINNGRILVKTYHRDLMKEVKTKKSVSYASQPMNQSTSHDGDDCDSSSDESVSKVENVSDKETEHGIQSLNLKETEFSKLLDPVSYPEVMLDSSFGSIILKSVCEERCRHLSDDDKKNIRQKAIDKLLGKQTNEAPTVSETSLPLHTEATVCDDTEIDFHSASNALSDTSLIDQKEAEHTQHNERNSEKAPVTISTLEELKNKVQIESSQNKNIASSSKLPDPESTKDKLKKVKVNLTIQKLTKNTSVAAGLQSELSKKSVTLNLDPTFWNKLKGMNRQDTHLQGSSSSSSSPSKSIVTKRKIVESLTTSGSPLKIRVKELSVKSTIDESKNQNPT
uniref:Uncharacterized protein n=1 Tax=Clytia hemisphaerica TaxID=252671 RepID=A0A7M5XGX0_9CNID